MERYAYNYVIHSFLRVRVPINAKSGIAVPLQGGRVWWHCNTWACNRGIQWDGDMHISTHASAFVLAIMALLSSCHACGCVFEQQEELCASPTEWKSSEFHSFTVCLLFCAFIVVIKELKAVQHFNFHPRKISKHLGLNVCNFYIFYPIFKFGTYTSWSKCFNTSKFTTMW